MARNVRYGVPQPGQSGSRRPRRFSAPKPQPYGVGGAWTLDFADEFEGTTLDTNRWVAKSGGTINNVSPSPANVVVAGGVVTLQLSSSTVGAAISTAPGEGPTTGYLLPTNAYLEFRGYFPGDGTVLYNWPALWASGTNYPSYGEIDVAEVISQQITSNYHGGYVSGGAQTTSRNGPQIPGTWQNGWHIFGAYRRAAFVDVYYDGRLVQSYPTGDLGGGECILINIGTSGTAVTGATGALKVDYVRTWLRQGAEPSLTSISESFPGGTQAGTPPGWSQQTLPGSVAVDSSGRLALTTAASYYGLTSGLMWAAMEPAADVDVSFEFTVPTLGEQYPGISVRATYPRDDRPYPRDGYTLELAPSSGSLTLLASVYGVNEEVRIGTAAFTFAANVVTKGRIQAIGSTIRARLWTGATEPTTWPISVTDTRVTTPGRVMLNGQTGADSVARTAAWDNFVASVPVSTTALTANLVELDGLSAALVSATVLAATLVESDTTAAALLSPQTLAAGLAETDSLTAALTSPTALSAASAETDTLAAAVKSATALTAAFVESDAVVVTLVSVTSLVAGLAELDTLAATLASATALTASLAEFDTFAVAVQTSSVLSAVLTEADNLTAGLSSASALTATIVDSDSLAAVLQTSAAAVAGLVETDALAASLVSSSALVATLVESDTLAATLRSVTILAAGLVESDTLTGSLQTTTAVAANLAEADTLAATVQSPMALTANSAESDTLVALLQSATVLTANVAESDTLAATLIVPGALSVALVEADTLAANLVSVTVLTASLTETDNLSAVLKSASSLNAASVETDALSAVLTSSAALAGNIVSADQVAVVMRSPAALSAAIVSTDTLTATLVTAVSLAGALVETDSLTGTLTSANAVPLVAGLAESDQLAANLASATQLTAFIAEVDQFVAQLTTVDALIAAFAESDAITVLMSIPDNEHNYTITGRIDQHRITGAISHAGLSGNVRVTTYQGSIHT